MDAEAFARDVSQELVSHLLDAGVSITEYHIDGTCLTLTVEDETDLDDLAHLSNTLDSWLDAREAQFSETSAATPRADGGYTLSFELASNARLPVLYE